MIPKVIHYCWFGLGEIPEKDKRCIESWKKYCPDYEIKRWDESNYDVTANEYMKQAYQAKKWGFVPDYARLDIIYNNGGIYLDTDVEIISSIDDLLSNHGFAGFESERFIALGLGFAAEKGNEMIKSLMDQYEDLIFINDDGSLNTTASPVLSSEIFKAEGFALDGSEQCVNGFHVYPKEYFCPMDYQTGKLVITDNTRSIHWYNSSWFPEIRKKEIAVQRKLINSFGQTMGSVVFKMYKYLFNPKRLLKRIINKDDVYYKEYSDNNE